MTRRDPRRGEPEIVVFGRHPVQEALRSDGVEVLEVKIARGLSRADRLQLRKQAAAAAVDFDEVSRETLDFYTDAPRHDQGIAARVRLLRVIEVDSLIAAATGRAARKPLRLIGLDGVTNSQNVGMVVRSVVGAGLDGLLWPMIGLPWVNGLVVRAAAGALFECPIVRCDSMVGGLASLQAAGFSVYGLDANAPVSLFETTPGHRAAYILGSEALGLSDDVRGMLDQPVCIPMAGRLESLNVAVAAGLVAFHAAGLLGARP